MGVWVWWVGLGGLNETWMSLVSVAVPQGATCRDDRGGRGLGGMRDSRWCVRGWVRGYNRVG